MVPRGPYRGQLVVGEVVHIKPQQDPKVEMFAVLPENLASVIDDARRFIGMSTERQSNVAADHIIQDLHDSMSLLWMVYVDGTPMASVVTCILHHPLRRNMKIEWMGGEKMHLWGNEVFAILTKVAKEAKMDAIEADGRKGFAKYAEAASFYETRRHYEMELSQ